MLLAALVAGCQIGDQADTETTGPGDGQAHVGPLDLSIEPPLGMGLDTLRPRTGEALQNARASLQEILAELELPDYLAKSQSAPAAPASQPNAPAQDTDRREDIASRYAVKMYAAGRAAYRQGRAYVAIQALNKAHRADPGAVPIVRLLGRIYMETGNKVQGAVHLRRAVIGQPDDRQSLFLLGRYAYANSRWSEAAVVLGSALRMEEPPVAAGLAYLLHYYLAQTLIQMDRDGAAIDQFAHCLSLPVHAVYPTRLTRELAVLTRRRDVLYLQMGDAHVRLGQFGWADALYQQIGDAAQVDAAALAARRTYVKLVLQQLQPAEDIVIGLIAQTGSDDQQRAVALARYVIDNGGSSQRIVDDLHARYRQTDRPDALLMVLTALTDQDRARALLREHLEARPHDLAVYKRLIILLLEANPAEALSLAVGMIDQHGVPEAYARPVLTGPVEAEQLLAAMDGVDKTLKATAAGQYLHGRIARSAGQLDLAEQAFGRAMAVDGDFLPARLQIIELCLATDRAERAGKLADELAEATDEKVRFFRVQVYMRLERYDEAADLLDQLLSEYPRNVRYLVQKAHLQLRTSDEKAAARTLWSVLEADPTHEPAYEMLFALYRPGDSDYGQLLDRARTKIPHSYVTRFQLARKYIADDQHSRAEPLLRVLLRQRPEDDAVLRMLVEVLLSEENLAQAEQILMEQMRQRPKAQMPVALYELVAASMGKRAEAYPKYEAVFRQLKPGQEKWEGLARVYELWGKPDQARQSWNELLVWYDQQIAEDPEQAADLYCEKARVLLGMGDAERGDEALLAALQVDPKHDGANNDLGYQWADDGRNLDRARQMIEKAVQADGTNAAYVDSLGWVLYKQEHFDEAVRRLEEAASLLHGTEPVILDHLGDALWRAGRKPQAAPRWRQAVRRVKLARRQALTSPLWTMPSDWAKVERQAQAKLNAVKRNQPPIIAPLPGEAPPARPTPSFRSIWNVFIERLIELDAASIPAPAP